MSGLLLRGVLKHSPKVKDENGVKTLMRLDDNLFSRGHGALSEIALDSKPTWNMNK
jgi:hypothetical protein